MQGIQTVLETPVVPSRRRIPLLGLTVLVLLLLVLFVFWRSRWELSGPVQQSESAPAAALVEDESGAPLDPSEDPENQGLGGVLAVFTIEPLAAPCCPLPTEEKALEAARSIPGVLAAQIDEQGALSVRFDPEQTGADAIASAVNQPSFIVEIGAPSE